MTDDVPKCVCFDCLLVSFLYWCFVIASSNFVCYSDFLSVLSALMPLFGLSFWYIQLPEIAVIVLYLCLYVGCSIIIPSFTGFKCINSFLLTFLLQILLTFQIWFKFISHNIYFLILLFFLTLFKKGWFTQYHIHCFGWFCSLTIMYKDYHIGHNLSISKVLQKYLRDNPSFKQVTILRSINKILERRS